MMQYAEGMVGGEQVAWGEEENANDYDPEE